MRRLALRWLILAASVYGASLITESLGLGFSTTPIREPADALKLLIGVAVLSLLNASLGRFIKILTLPLRCLTLGFFSLVVNAFVLYVSARLDLGFRVADGVGGFGAAFVASILISVINGVLGMFLPDDD